MLSDGSYCCKRLTEGNFFFFKTGQPGDGEVPLTFMSLPCCLCQVLRLHNCTFYKLTTRKVTKNLRYNVHTDILCHQIRCLWHSIETLYITSTFLKVLTNFSFFFSHFLYSSFTVSVIDQGEVIMTHNPQLQYGHGFDLQTGQI